MSNPRSLHEFGCDVLDALDGGAKDTLPFEAFCDRYLRVQDKSGALVPLRLNRAQRHLITHLTGHDLVLKSRQIGVSTVIQAWFYYLETVHGDVRTSTLCHEDELTQEIRAMNDRFHEHISPRIQATRQLANAKVTTYPAKNSQARIATVGGLAGKRKGRGGSNTHLHGSEVAFWPDANGVMAAAMQAGNPFIILESTPNGMSGWFYDRCQGALDGTGEWTLHFYEWWWDDDYRVPLAPGETLIYTDDEQALVDRHGLDAEQIKWRRQKQADIPHEFAQEYPEDPYSCFLASGQSYFRNVEHIFVAPEPVEPDPTRQYVGGLDFAQTGDFTVLSIFDQQTLQQVDYLRINNLPWQEMRRRISITANKWNARVVGEANSMGTTNIELLQSGETLDDGSKIEPVNLVAFDTTPASKPPLIQALYHAFHEEGMTLFNRPEIKHEVRAYVSVQLPSGHWRYEGGDGAHDDIVMAAALANHGLHTPAFAAFH